MPYAFYFDVPGDEHIYEQVSDRIGEVRPDGLITAVVTKTDHGVRHLNVWKSQEQWVHFRDTYAAPAVAAVLTDLGIPVPAEPPVEHELDLVHAGL